MDRDTEIRKLAYVMDAQGRTFRHLQPLDAPQINMLRVHVMNRRLLNSRIHPLAKIAKLSFLLPGRLLAWFCENYLGAFFTAYLAHFVPAKRMGRLAKHISASFLADCAVHLVPEKVREALEMVPLHLMADAARILAARREYAVLGSLFDVTPEGRLVALMSAVPSATDRLSISRYISQKQRMVKLMDMLPDQDLKELIAVAFTSDEYLSELGALVGHMSESQIKRTAKLVAGLLDSHVQGLIRRLMSSPRLLERFSGLLQQLPEKSLSTLVGAVEGLDDNTFQALKMALTGMDRAAEVLPKVLTALHADAKSRIGGLISGIGSVMSTATRDFASEVKAEAETKSDTHAKANSKPKNKPEKRVENEAERQTERKRSKASPANVPTAPPQEGPTAFELHLQHEAAKAEAANGESKTGESKAIESKANQEPVAQFDDISPEQESIAKVDPSAPAPESDTMQSPPEPKST